jgi:chromosomal replication initiator protein
VIAHSKLVGKPITIENTQHILKDLLRSNEKIVTIEEIQKKVCDHFNIKISDMTSSRRLRSVARPRQIAMYLAKNLTPKSLAEIGKKFGGKDHTTVMHAIRTIEGLIASSTETKEDTRLLSRILEG